MLFSYLTEVHQAVQLALLRLLPNGRRTERAMVRHQGLTGIVPLLDDGKIVMVSQYRHSVGDYLLEIPAGTVAMFGPKIKGEFAEYVVRKGDSLWKIANR